MTPPPRYRGGGRVGGGSRRHPRPRPRTVLCLGCRPAQVPVPVSPSTTVGVGPLLRDRCFVSMGGGGGRDVSPFLPQNSRAGPLGTLSHFRGVGNTTTYVYRWDQSPSDYRDSPFDSQISLVLALGPPGRSVPFVVTDPPAESRTASRAGTRDRSRSSWEGTRVSLRQDICPCGPSPRPPSRRRGPHPVSASPGVRTLPGHAPVDCLCVCVCGWWLGCVYETSWKRRGCHPSLRGRRELAQSTSDCSRS